MHMNSRLALLNLQVSIMPSAIPFEFLPFPGFLAKYDFDGLGAQQRGTPSGRSVALPGTFLTFTSCYPLGHGSSAGAALSKSFSIFRGQKVARVYCFYGAASDQRLTGLVLSFRCSDVAAPQTHIM